MTTGIFLFLNIGTSEMMLILFVALFLFGGKKLPELARGLGRGIREFKDASETIKKDINEQINNFEEEIDEVKSDIKSITDGAVEEDTPSYEAAVEEDTTQEDIGCDDGEVSTEHQDDISHSDQYYHNYDYNYPEDSTEDANVSANSESLNTDTKPEQDDTNNDTK